MHKKLLIKLSVFLLVILCGLTCSRVYAFDIPAALPNAFDPGQVQKNIQLRTNKQRLKALPAVEQTVQPHAPIPGAETVHFELKKVTFKGNTVFTHQQLEAIFSSSLNKTITVAQLQALVQEVTLLYRNAGYILSRAILPPQEIKNGEVKIEIIEGFINSVTVTGTPKGSKKLIEEYGQHITESKPLNLSAMEREILLMNDLPGISVKALIIPSKTIPDAADLVLVVDQRTLNASIEHDNYSTRYLGPNESSLSLAANSIFISGDTTGGNATVTARVSEMQYYNLYYTVPLNSKGLSFTIGTSYTATQPQFLLASSETVGMSASAYANLTYSMIRSRSQNLYLHAMANYQNVTSTILGFPLYQDRVRYLDLGTVWDTTDRWNGSDNLGFDAIHGFPILGAQMHELQSRPEGRAQYTRATASLSRLQPIYKLLSLYTAFSGQYSFQPLLATEQFSIGGPIYGRGYGPSEIVGDRGLAGKIELRIDTQPAKSFLQTIEYYVFYDAGAIWNLNTSGVPPRQDLTSTGAGLRLVFIPQIYGELYVAKPLSRQCTTLTPTDQNPQQARAFFQIVARL